MGINVEGSRIVTESPPGAERFLGSDGYSVHRNPVSQQAEHRKTTYEAGANSSVRLLILPPLDRLIGGVPLNQQRKEDVSVRYTHHSDE